MPVVFKPAQGAFYQPVGLKEDFRFKTDFFAIF